MSGNCTKNAWVRSLSKMALGLVVLASISCSSDSVGPIDSPGAEDPTRQPVPTDGAAIAGLLLPRPTTIEGLTTGPDVIFIGTIASLIAEREIGPYGADGLPGSAGGPAVSVTDFAVSVERVLKSDGVVQGFGLITLRMYGHGPPETGFALSIAAILPEIGERLLFLLGRNPDGTYGAGDEGLMVLGNDAVMFHDGAPFGDGIGTDDMLAEIAAQLSR